MGETLLSAGGRRDGRGELCEGHAFGMDGSACDVTDGER